MSKEYNKTVSDEQIIAALMAGGSVTAAADQLKVSPRTIYNRMRGKDFKLAYMEVKTDIMRNAAADLSSRVSQAVEVICDIMQNEDNPPGVRLQAAQQILNQAGSFSKRLTASEVAIESRVFFDL